MSSYFEEAFRRAFPARPAPRPYVWPTLIKTVSVTEFTARETTVATGTRTAIAVRTVTTQGLVTSYRYSAPVWTRNVPVRDVPESSYYPADTKSGKGQSAKSGRRDMDPYGTFAFVIDIEGLGKMGFQKFDGIDVEIDQIEYKDGLDPHPHKRPGIVRYGNLKLSKGMIANKELWNWIDQTRHGKLTRRNGSIHILKDTHDANDPEVVYDFIQAWPCKWSGLRIEGKSDGALIEELELAIDYIARSK